MFLSSQQPQTRLETPQLASAEPNWQYTHKLYPIPWNPHVSLVFQAWVHGYKPTSGEKLIINCFFTGPESSRCGTPKDGGPPHTGCRCVNGDEDNEESFMNCNLNDSGICDIDDDAQGESFSDNGPDGPDESTPCTRYFPQQYQEFDMQVESLLG